MLQDMVLCLSPYYCCSRAISSLCLLICHLCEQLGQFRLRTLAEDYVTVASRGLNRQLAGAKTVLLPPWHHFCCCRAPRTGGSIVSSQMTGDRHSVSWTPDRTRCNKGGDLLRGPASRELIQVLFFSCQHIPALPWSP